MADPQQRLTSLLDQADTLLSKQASAHATPPLTVSRQWRGRWLHKAVQRWLQDNADLDSSAKAALAALPELLGHTALRGEQPWSAFDVPARQLAELEDSLSKSSGKLVGLSEEGAALSGRMNALIAEAQPSMDHTSVPRVDPFLGTRVHVVGTRQAR